MICWKRIFKILLLSFIIINNCHAIAQKNDPLCGPQSLLAICKRLGVSATLEELCTLTDYTEQSGTTMFGLYQATIKKGLPAVPVKIDIEQLCEFKNPSIIFVDNNHFLVMYGCKWGKVIIQNPPDPLVKVSKKEFQKRWNGEALVFSEQFKKQVATQIVGQTASLKGPHIHFQETEQYFGVVNEGEVLKHTFKFTNIGTDTIKVYVRSNCGCTAALLSDKNILPGGTGEIKLEYNTKGRKGNTKQGADVKTNDPDKPWITLSIYATVRSSIKVVPENLWLGEIAKGDVVSRELLVIDPGDSTLVIDRVEVQEGITAEILPVRDESGILSVPVSLTIRREEKPGKFEKQITIYTNDPNRKEITVPISGVVLADVRALPPVIFFGEVKPDTKVVREITLLTTNGKQIEIIKTTTETLSDMFSIPNISTEIKSNNNDSKFTLVTTLQTPKNSTTIRDNIQIYINGNNEPAIEIPIYARVEGMKQ